MAVLSKEEEIQAKVKFTNELCITFDKEKVDMQCKLNENHNVIQNIASQLHELKIEKDSLENQIKNYKSIIDCNQSLIIQLKKENEEFKAINAEITQASINDIEKLKKDKEIVTTQFMHFKTISEECEKVLTTNLEELKITNESIQSKANELNNVIASNQMDKAQLKKEYEQLREKSEQTIKVLTQDQIAKSKVFEEKVAQLTELQIQNIELQYQIERIATNYQEKLAKSEESKASYEKQINISKNVMNANKVKIDALISEKNDMQATAENISLHFTNEIEELKAKYLFLENNSGKIISSKQNEIQQLENKIATLNVNIEEIRLLNNHHVEDLRNKNVALEKQICECNNNIESKETSITQLEMENHNLVTKLEEITNLKNIEVKKVMKENETLEMKIKQIQKENTLLQTKICELTAVHTFELSETRKEKEAMDKKNSEMANVLECNQTNITLFSNENKALKAKIEEIMFLKTGEISEQKQIFEKKLSELKHIIENNRVEVEHLKIYIKQLETNIEEINRVKITEGKEMVMELEKDSKIKMLASEVAALNKIIAHREGLFNDVKVNKEKDMADLQKQVNLLSSDLIETSEERNVTISNLEKIVYDKNRIITTLQSEITYLKSLVADSENKLLDVSKEFEQCRENCQDLSTQLKRCVGQKNEEINNLKKTLSKLSTTESKACKIIKVSAKYQAIILKRIAEIKSTSALRELTQFSNVDDKRRSLASGAVTMDELESFLENTERQMRKLTEKQSCLQKERDHFAEINKINEAEAFSVKKYLTELLAHFKTFSSVKEVYNQKLSQVISQQRIIRREIHSLDQNIPENVMSKLERSYGVVMQDLVETALNIGRWAERCIDRSISPEKLKQAFACDAPPLSTSQLQNTGLEVQIDELLTAFKKVQEQVQMAKSSGGARGGGEACSVMEVRAEYEDKLNRMKAKMKQLYQEQMSAYQARQEAELSRLQRKLDEKTKAYEEHIRDLTKELWSVGEKFLMKKEEAEWLRRRPSSSSLMSLQHVHSSGLGPAPARDSRDSGRATDTQSLHRVPAQKPTKSEGRGFHMSDEEGEVFDNRWLKELETPPRPSDARRRDTAGGAGGAGRISELKYRNSLCPPHLKSSYPAETHFAPLACNEDEIKFEGCGGGGGGGGGAVERRNRKEVGITAYKKPGPPTPSKNAGRLSATDSELRESLRPELESAAPQRKASTPSRIRALFRSHRSDAESVGTPRSKRLSIFRKKQ